MDFIPQMEPWFGAEEKEALNQYMDEGGWLTEFKKTTAFEQSIADFTNAKHCIVVNNGTISLTLMALAAGLKAGDEVLVPNYTMIATPNSVKMFGATPVFVDVEPETLCMDLEAARKAITPRTKALFFVNANGRYPLAGIEAFQKLCLQNKLILLEDAAQALGSWYPNGKHQGTVGLAGSFSFSAPKVITTGQGGAIVTNDDAMAFRLRRLKDFGRSGGGNDVHDSIGYNFKFTELQAVIGIEQMKKLRWRLDRKKAIFRLYLEKLKAVPQISLFNHDLNCTSPWFIDSIAEDRENLQLFLKDRNIGTRVMYPPINKQNAYLQDSKNTNLQDSDFPVSNLIGKSGLWLPSSSRLSDSEINCITDAIIEFYSN